MANDIVTLRKEILTLSRAYGVAHPSQVSPHQIEILDCRFGSRTVADLLGGRGHGVAFDDDPENTFVRERGVPETNVDHAA